MGLTFIGCAFCSWFILILNHSHLEKIRYALLCALVLALALGTHPITALYSTAFLGIIFLFSIFYSKDRHINLLVGVGIFLFLCVFLSPWIYPNLIFLKKLAISKEPALSFYPQNADAWWTRFQIFPFDKRSLLKGQNVDTCYLDTQINMALLIFVSGFVWISGVLRKSQSRRGFFILGVFLFFVTSWMSLSTVPYEFLPKQFKLIQFGWRLITYQNLSLLLIFIGLITENPKLVFNIKKDPTKVAIIAISLTLAFVNTVERATHSMGARNPVPDIKFGFHAPKDPSFVNMPSWNYYAYFVHDISSAKITKTQQNPNLTFDVGLNKNFGEPLPKQLALKSSGWLKTNVGAFDWNKIYEDGVIVSPEKIRRNGNFLVAWVDRGQHSMTTSFEVPALLKMLKVLSLISLVLVFFAFLCIFSFGAQRKGSCR